MPITYSNAIDEMFGMVNAELGNVCVVLTYDVFDMRWPGAPNAVAPDATKFWGRTSAQIVKDDVTSIGGKKYTATGLLYVQLFCPRNVANTLVLGRQVAALFRDAFRQPSVSGAINFYNQKIVELPETEDNHPMNVVVTFEYDSVIV